MPVLVKGAETDSENNPCFWGDDQNELAGTLCAVETVEIPKDQFETLLASATKLEMVVRIIETVSSFELQSHLCAALGIERKGK